MRQVQAPCEDSSGARRSPGWLIMSSHCCLVSLLACWICTEPFVILACMSLALLGLYRTIFLCSVLHLHYVCKCCKRFSSLKPGKRLLSKKKISPKETIKVGKKRSPKDLCLLIMHEVRSLMIYISICGLNEAPQFMGKRRI